MTSLADPSIKALIWCFLVVSRQHCSFRLVNNQIALMRATGDDVLVGEGSQLLYELVMGQRLLACGLQQWAAVIIRQRKLAVLW